MKLLISLLIVFTFIASCNGRKTTNSQPIATDSAEKIYMNILVAKPIFVTAFKDSTDKDFIIGVRPYNNPLTNYIITRIVNLNSNWQTEKEDTIGNDLQVNILDSFKAQKIQNKYYVSFTAKHYMPGSLTEGMASVEFHLINTNDLHDYALAYKGDEVEENTISGEFVYDNLLNKSFELKQFQEARSLQSKYIYKKTANDYDISSNANHKKKWLIDNPEIETKEYVYEQPINLTYYNNLLQEIEKHYTGGSNLKSFENVNYKIIVLWRSGVYGVEKMTGKQFPIWLYNCNSDWELYAEFIDHNKLLITNENCYSVTVDLDKKIYSRKQLEN